MPFLDFVMIHEFAEFSEIHLVNILLSLCLLCRQNNTMLRIFVSICLYSV